MKDIELKILLQRGGISPLLFEGEVGSKNMDTWRRLAHEFQEYFADQQLIDDYGKEYSLVGSLGQAGLPLASIET